MNTDSWLLFLYSLPSSRNTERVAVWRKLKKFGAIQIKTSTYLLPDSPAHYERFQWLAKEVRDSGGESTLIRAKEIEGLPHDEIVGLFNSAREKVYGEILRALRELPSGRGKARKAVPLDELEKSKRRFRETREVDFFNCPRAHDVQALLNRVGSAGHAGSKQEAKLDSKAFRNKTWLTRPRPEIDRVGSAWLIKQFIDPEAKFVFSASPAAFPQAIPFDMLDVEFSHHGGDCTFETLTKRFAISDKAVHKISEMIHDADLEDGKFQRNECLGIDRILKGWGKRGVPDKEILQNGFACFDGLYTYLQRA